MAGIDASLEDLSTRVATLPRSMWRRRADTTMAPLPGGIRMAVLTSPFIVRWAAWGVALLIYLVADLPHANERFEPWLLAGTAAQLVLLTFYMPFIRPTVLERLRRFTDEPGNFDVLGADVGLKGENFKSMTARGHWSKGEIWVDNLVAAKPSGRSRRNFRPNPRSMSRTIRRSSC